MIENVIKKPSPFYRQIIKGKFYSFLAKDCLAKIVIYPVENFNPQREIVYKTYKTL